MQQERDVFVFISSSESALARLKQASEFLSLQIPHYKSLQLFLEDDKRRPRTVLMDMREVSADDQAILPKIKLRLPKTQVVALVESLHDRKPQWYFQHYLAPDIWESFVLEYLLFQKNYSEFLEISASDLFPDTLVYFNAYHFLPLNQKYLPMVHEDFKLSERKHKRIEIFKTLYLNKSDTQAYTQYIEKYFDQFSVGLKKRAKAKLYQLLVEWRDIFYSDLLEIKEVESILIVRPDFYAQVQEFLKYVVASSDPWALLHELSLASAFEFERSLIELLISTYLAQNLGEDEVKKMIDLRFLLALTRVRSDSLLFKRWYLGQELSEEEKRKWGNYPDSIKNYKVAADFPVDVLEDLVHYQAQFLTRTDTNVVKGRLNYTYLGELIAQALRKFSIDQYNKEVLLENIIIKCKADAILTEAWLEELRQFLRKQEKP